MYEDQHKEELMDKLIEEAVCETQLRREEK